MIQAADTEFPNNCIALMAARVQSYCDPDAGPGDERVKVFKRPLRTSDPTQSVGIFPSMKRPDNNSIEIQSVEPTLKRYTTILQTLVQDSQEEAAISIHSILSNRLWRMLYRDSPLKLGLTSLSVVADNSVERLQRRGIELQRYLSNEVNGSFVQTSWIECWFETETVETS